MVSVIGERMPGQADGTTFLTADDLDLYYSHPIDREPELPVPRVEGQGCGTRPQHPPTISGPSLAGRPPACPEKILIRAWLKASSALSVGTISPPLLVRSIAIEPHCLPIVGSDAGVRPVNAAALSLVPPGPSGRLWEGRIKACIIRTYGEKTMVHLLGCTLV